MQPFFYVTLNYTQANNKPNFFVTTIYWQKLLISIFISNTYQQFYPLFPYFMHILWITCSYKEILKYSSTISESVPEVSFLGTAGKFLIFARTA